jgi:hypothetical protein
VLLPLLLLLLLLPLLLLPLAHAPQPEQLLPLPDSLPCSREPSLSDFQCRRRRGPCSCLLVVLVTLADTLIYL